MPNIDELIAIVDELDRACAANPTDELRAAMAKLVRAVWDEHNLRTRASKNPLWVAHLVKVRAKSH